MIVNIHTHSPKKGELTLSTIGIHPYDAEGASTDSIFAIERVADRYDAIGEIGLDYACDVDKDKQLLVFQAQLEIAQRAGKGVVLHSVRTFEKVMECLKNYSLKFVIFHGLSALQSRHNRLQNGATTSRLASALFALQRALKR